MAIYSYLIFKLMEFGTYLPYKLSLALTMNLFTLVKIYNFFFGEKKKSVSQER